MSVFTPKNVGDRFTKGPESPDPSAGEEEENENKKQGAPGT